MLHHVFLLILNIINYMKVFFFLCGVREREGGLCKQGVRSNIPSSHGVNSCHTLKHYSVHGQIQ